MDGSSANKDKKLPRSLKHIQTGGQVQTHPLLNPHVLLEKNAPLVLPAIKKVEQGQPRGRSESPVEHINFRQAI